MRFVFLYIAMIVLVPIFAEGGALDLGPITPIVRTDSDEQFYLVKDAFLTSGSPAPARKTFDHNMHDVVKLFFSPKNEKNFYVAESKWMDPLGTEFLTIRTVYDKQEETKNGIERPKGGATRVHTMPTAELFAHKPGMWKVELSLDGKLARRLFFSVR